MRIVKYKKSMLDECIEFWWNIYEKMPYIHRPDGIVLINAPSVGPEYCAKILGDGLRGETHWDGTIDYDCLVMIEDEGKLAGFLLCSIDKEKLTGNILSCYVQRDLHGREVANCLVDEALERFRKRGLLKAVAGPGIGRCLEVETPAHLAILDAGFAWNVWENDWQPPYATEQYGVFLGGSLESFGLKPEIMEKREKLYRDGIEIKFVIREEFRKLHRYDTGGAEDKPELEYCDDTFVALVDGFAVGWLSEWGAGEDDPPGIITGEAIPEVIPMYQRKGIGKVLYHLGINEMVKQGMRCGWTATGIYSPARLIYHSIGYRYWSTCFDGMKKWL